MADNSPYRIISDLDRLQFSSDNGKYAIDSMSMNSDSFNTVEIELSEKDIENLCSIGTAVIDIGIGHDIQVSLEKTVTESRKLELLLSNASKNLKSYAKSAEKIDLLARDIIENAFELIDEAIKSLHER